MLPNRPHISLLFFLTLMSLIWALNLNYAEFGGREAILYCAYILAVLFIQLAIVFVLGLTSKTGAKLAKFLAGFFAAFNAYTLVIQHSRFFSTLDQALLVAALADLGLGLAFIFSRDKALLKFLHLFAGIMIAVTSVQFFFNHLAPQDSTFKTIPDHFRYVEFQKKPNIYVISFDAMVPEAIGKNLIGVSEVAYVNEFKRQSVRIIPNTFAERVPTKQSLNSFLAMDIAYYQDTKEKNGFIRNQNPNPAYEILRHNGYKIQFFYNTSYFGDDRGRLDFYGIAEPNGLCKHVEKPSGFMGYCLKAVQKPLQKLANIMPVDYLELLTSRIKYAAQSNQPWFTMAYIYAPGHTKLSYDAFKESDREAYKKEFYEASKEVIPEIKTVIETIRAADPGGVIILFGDHGAMVSKGVVPDNIDYALRFSPDALPEGSPLSYKDAVQDRHAVFHAIYPADFCPEGFRQNPYSTIRIMRDVMKCLSNGEDPLPESYQPDDSHWAPYRFE